MNLRLGQQLPNFLNKRSRDPVFAIKYCKCNIFGLFFLIPISFQIIYWIKLQDSAGFELRSSEYREGEHANH